MSTLGVQGDAALSACLRKAGAIIYDSYGRGADSVHPDLRPWVNAIWDTWQQPVHHDHRDIGLHARFYRPLGQPGSQGYCPPVLAFRGSEVTAHDISDLALVLRISLDFDSDRFLSGREAVLDSLTSLANWWTNGMVFVLGHPDNIPTDHATAVAHAEGLPYSRSIANIPGQTRIRVRNVLTNSRDLFGAEEITINYQISLRLHFGDRGDWSTNITQGMGEPARQYELAAEYGRQYAAEADTDWNKHLIVTGHSLGGGLAALAAIAGKKTNPDCSIHCATYNAVGVHGNSVNRYAPGATLDENPSTRNYSVMDEILTTLQMYQSKLPLVTPIIRWANTLPNSSVMEFTPARNSTSTVHGVSPGSSQYSQLFAMAYDQLPVLWPLSQNTLRQAQIRLQEDPQSTDFINDQRAARNAAEREIYSRYDPQIETLWQNMNSMILMPGNSDPLEIDRIRREISALEQAGEAELAALDHLYDTHVPTFPDLRNTGNFPLLTMLDQKAKQSTAETFVAGLVGFIMTGEFGSSNGAPYNFSVFDIGAIRQRIDQLTMEGAGVAPIGAATVLYHTFDPCAFTFYNPRG